MKKRHIITVMALTVLAAAVIAQPPGRHHRGGGPGGGMIVRLADGDADGTITSAEFDAFLAALDANGDGVVEDGEIHDFVSSRRDGMRRRSGGPGPRASHPFDQDGDGVIETADFEAIFAGLDADADGELTGAELPSFRDRRGPRMSFGAGLLFHEGDADGDGEVTNDEWQSLVSRLDADGSGVIDEAEWFAAAPGPPGREPPPGHFDRITRWLDRDDDGILEAADFDAVFSEVDADGNGVLEAGELPRRGPRHRHG